MKKNKYLEQVHTGYEVYEGFDKVHKIHTRRKNAKALKVQNKYITKAAAQAQSKPVKEKPHVIRALAKLDKENGILLDHSMGSGKTRLFLKAVEIQQARNKDKNARSLVIAPASLVTNIEKEVIKHHLKIDMSKVDAMSYEKAVIDADKLRKNKYLIAIADEGQKLRNVGTQRHDQLSRIFQDADKRIVATGTPYYNHVSDIGPLVNIAAGRQVLPEGKKDFENEYVETGTSHVPILSRIMGAEPQEVHTIKNKKKLGNILNKYIDHYDLSEDPTATDLFPTKTEKVIQVHMSPTQMGLYKYYEGNLPWLLKMKVRSGIALNRRDSSALNIYAQAIRQVSNSSKPFMSQYDELSPKLQTAVDNLEKEYKKNKNHKALVYSTYKNAGVDEYSNELTKRGIEHSVYHGGLSKTQKDAMIDAHNAAKRHVLLVTSSGAEGLNLLGTRQVQILEPHFNRSKINQVIGRASRMNSHAHLPPAERNVSVEHYQSIFPDTMFGKSKEHAIDDYLYHNSQTKDTLSEQARDLIKS